MKTKLSMQKILLNEKIIRPLAISAHVYPSIYFYLDGKSLMALSKSCRYFNKNVTDRIWKVLVEREIALRPILETSLTKGSTKAKETYKSYYQRAMQLFELIELAKKELREEALVLKLNQLTVSVIRANWDCDRYINQIPSIIFSSRNINNYRDGILKLSFLHIAAQAGSYEFLKYLLECGSEKNACLSGILVYHAGMTGMRTGNHLCSGPKWIENWGATPLMLAARAGNLKCMEVLFKNNVDINYSCLSEGNTALHEAASSGNVDCIKILIQKGALLTQKNKVGELPFQCASTLESEQVIIKEMQTRNVSLPSSRCTIS